MLTKPSHLPRKQQCLFLICLRGQVDRAVPGMQSTGKRTPGPCSAGQHSRKGSLRRWEEGLERRRKLRQNGPPRGSSGKAAVLRGWSGRGSHCANSRQHGIHHHPLRPGLQVWPPLVRGPWGWERIVFPRPWTNPVSGPLPAVSGALLLLSHKA